MEHEVLNGLMGSGGRVYTELSRSKRESSGVYGPSNFPAVAGKTPTPRDQFAVVQATMTLSDGSPGVDFAVNNDAR